MNATITATPPIVGADPLADAERDDTRGEHEGVFLSVVVPCYNEEANLRELHRRVTSVCRQLLKPYEIVFVNDGSTDGTWPSMLCLAERDRRVAAINLSRNFGKESALTAGLELCQGERVLILDADLQDPPELLPRMLAMMDDGSDVVYGRRRTRAGESLFKRGTAAIFYRLLGALAENEIPRDAGDFRLINRRTLEAVLRLPERRRFVRGLISWVGFRQTPIEFDRPGRQAGSTNYPLGKMTRLAIDAITSFSTRPLSLACWAAGAAAALAGAFSVGFAFAWRATGEPNTLLGVLAGLALASSTQLLALGIIGQYVGRVFEQSRGRPLFIVQEVVRGQSTDEVRNDNEPRRAK